MAQFYSLEEAARVLGISSDELKAKAQSREIRAFMGGGTWQFRAADIEEFARQMGQGSSPDLSLSDVPGEGVSDDAGFDFSDLDLNTAEDRGPADISAALSLDADDDVVIREKPEEASSSSHIMKGVLPGESSKPAGDSDVRLLPESELASDSDVRLSPSPDASVSPASLADELSAAFEEIEPEAPAAAPKARPSAAGDTTIARSPFAEAEPAAAAGESDFELTPSSFESLTPDSGSDFELSAVEEGSDEFEATPLKNNPSDADVTAAGFAASGVSLRPSDTGLKIESAALGASSDSIELAPVGDSSMDIPVQKPKGDSQERDLFNDTDFELDVSASGSGSGEGRTMQLRQDSDFDLEEEGSSEIISLGGDADVDSNAATSLRAAVDEEEDDSGFGAAPASAPSTPELPVAAAAPAARVLPAGAQIEWGVGSVVALGFALFFAFFAAGLGVDLVRNMYQFQGETPVASGLIKSIAEMVAGS